MKQSLYPGGVESTKRGPVSEYGIQNNKKREVGATKMGEMKKPTTMKENKFSPIPSVPALVGSPVDGALAVPW